VGVRVSEELFHTAFIPMLSRTSRIRYTSSIFGTLVIVVVLLLRSEAHNMPTAEFFDELIDMVPERDFPPSILKFIHSLYSLDKKVKY